MFNNLLYAVKRRILDEVENAFKSHPAYSEKVKVYHKFPYEERIQYGMLLRNSSATQIRMSADNYLAEAMSHVRLVKFDNTPGLSIEWVRENANGITAYISEEDVSSQLDSTQRMFRTEHQIVSGPGNTPFANNIGQVVVTIDGIKILPEFVDGESRVVMLRGAPKDGAIVKISYYYKTISDPGIYVIDFIEDNKFLIAPVYIIEGEVLIDQCTGTETSIDLANNNIYPNSEMIYLKAINNDGNAMPQDLVPGLDYSIDYTTGHITFLRPLGGEGEDLYVSTITNYKLLADYRWQPTNYVNGPYDFHEYQELHNVIPGAVLSIGRRAKKGDRQGVYVTKEREVQARIYGGHWQMSLDLSVIAKDPIQMEEMTDHVINYLWGIRKNILEFEGITLNSVDPTGESEETFIETTGDLYYTSAISIDVMTEWQRFVPYLFEIKRIKPSIDFFPGSKDYIVMKNLQLIDKISPDTREVMKYPVIGYERVT